VIRRLIFGLAITASTFLVSVPAEAQASCQFNLGFKVIHDALAATVGDCVQNEYYNAIGDSNQQTTKGLLAWRKADNFTVFTDGNRTWVNGPNGLQNRLNTERFPWEADFGSPGTTAVGGAQVAPPAPPGSSPSTPNVKSIIPPAAPTSIGGNCFNSGFCYRTLYTFPAKNAIQVTAGLTFSGLASDSDFGGLFIGRVGGNDYRRIQIRSNSTGWFAPFVQPSGFTALLGGKGIPGAAPGNATVQLMLDAAGLNGTVAINGGAPAAFTLPTSASPGDTGPEVAIWGTTNVQTTITRLEVSPP